MMESSESWTGRIVLDVYVKKPGEGIKVVVNLFPHGGCPEGIVREECSTSIGAVSVVGALLSKLLEKQE